MKLLIITAGIIFGPLIIWGIAKIISKMSGTVKKANPFKFLGSVFSKPKKLIMWAMIGAIFYGGYLLVCYLWPTPERLAFKELSRNLAEIELKTEKDRLTAFNEKVKNGEKLTEAEKKEAMEADKKIERVRKDYSDGKLISPPQKSASAPVYKWIFGFKTEPEDIINAKGKDVDQICYRENDVINKPYFDKNEIRFKYKTSKNKTITAILDKKNPNETHFLGMVDLPDQTGKPKGRKLIIRLRESPVPDNFEGLIETWDGKNYYPQIPAFLKKVQVQ